MTYKYTILTFFKLQKWHTTETKSFLQPLEEHFQVIYLQRKITVTFIVSHVYI